MIVRIPWMLGWYAVVSVITFAAYAWDKHRAKVSAWRVKEQTLHVLEILGGWPGALLAQRQFHHKWKKAEYMRIFWAIVAIHMVGWGAWIYLRYFV